jgi:hypothetical protein
VSGTSAAVLSRIRGARLPDTDGWTNRFEIHSETSSRCYIIAEKVIGGQPSGLWACSCMGWKRYRGQCKHLTALGLPSCAAKLPSRPRSLAGVSSTGAEITVAGGRTLGGRNPSFSAAAYGHYDVEAEGFGSASAWIQAAADMAAGRGTFTPPGGGRAAVVTPDMRLLGITVMPAHAKGLLRAMYQQARKVHPDFVHPTDETHRRKFPDCPQCSDAAEAFTAVQMAYERLILEYAKAGRA